MAVSTVLQEINNQTLEDIKSLEVTGAVWSLDGKIHIQNSLNDKIAFPAYTSRIEIIDINSRKRKLDEIIHSEDKQTKICKSDQCKNKTDDSKEEKIKCCRANTTQETMKNMEIENLVTAHGKLLTACPYSSPKNGKCPLKFPIGQEFMGSCPFFDGSSENQLVKLHSKRSNYDIKKCPFMSNQVVVSDEGNSSNIDSQENICTASDSKAQNCTLSNKASLVGTKLYCGLTKHVQLPVEIIEKCENLGYDLAQSLIRNGALDVMHTAQEKIRGGFISN